MEPGAGHVLDSCNAQVLYKVSSKSEDDSPGKNAGELTPIYQLATSYKIRRFDHFHVFGTVQQNPWTKIVDGSKMPTLEVHAIDKPHAMAWGHQMRVSIDFNEIYVFQYPRSIY